MYTLAQRFSLAAVGAFLVGMVPAAHAQFQVSPGFNQSPFGAGAAGAAGSGAGNGFFSRSGAGQSGLGGLGPYASMSSTAASPYGGNGGYGGYGFSPYGFYGPYYNPANGNLYGAAAVINASSQYLSSVQQAYLMQQQLKREKLENRRRIFEEWLYERNNTPTTEDERDRLRKLSLRRAQNDPPTTEILSGRALNDLLLDAQQLQGKKITGPDIVINDDILGRINFAPKGRAVGSTGLLKNFKARNNRFAWPEALQNAQYEKERDLLNTLTKDAVGQASNNGQVDIGTINAMRNAVQQLQQGLRAELKQGLPSNQWIPAMTFLNDLNGSIRALSDPDALNLINGKYQPKAGSVADLVRDMASRGLEFAPAVPGEEWAYVALHRLLANYDTAAGANSMIAEQPPPQPQPQR